MKSQLELRTRQELEISRSSTKMNSERRKKLNLTVEQATDVYFLDQEVYSFSEMHKNLLVRTKLTM